LGVAGSLLFPCGIGSRLFVITWLTGNQDLKSGSPQEPAWPTPPVPYLNRQLVSQREQASG
jgi:hypothetical protein